jgi:hypothetical protein
MTAPIHFRHTKELTMTTTTTRLVLAAIALAASVTLASAQTTQDHDAHHSADQGATQVQPPGQRPMGRGPAQAMPMKPNATPGGQGMMMGADMAQMQMMAMMRDGMMPMGMGPAGARPFQHIEGQIAFYKAELKITDAQAPQWTAFADALRSNAARLQESIAQASEAKGVVAAPEQMERRIAILGAQLEMMKGL